MVCLPVFPTPLGQGGAKSTVSPVFVQGPIQPVMVDPMEGCGLQRSSAQSSLSDDDNCTKKKKKKADVHAGFTSCLQDLSSLAVLNILEIHIFHS